MESKSKLDELLKRIVNDLSGAFSTSVLYIGDKLHLFENLNSPMTSEELASKTNLNPRYVLEWLKAATASQFIEFDPETNKFWMTNEQTDVLVDSGDKPSINSLIGYSQFTIASLFNIPEVIEKGFKQGSGVPFSELGTEVSTGLCRMHAPVFHHKLSTWLISIPEINSVLSSSTPTSRVKFLDVGCGTGLSSRCLADEFEKYYCDVVGVDSDEFSISQAKLASGGRKNLSFCCGKIEEILDQIKSLNGFEIVLAFDCIHDMKDPVGSLIEIKKCLSINGVFVWSEPSGYSNPILNRNTKGKFRAALSPLHCLTVSMAQNGVGLGVMIGDETAEKLAKEAGFLSFKCYDVTIDQKLYVLS